MYSLWVRIKSHFIQKITQATRSDFHVVSASAPRACLAGPTSVWCCNRLSPFTQLNPVAAPAGQHVTPVLDEGIPFRVWIQRGPEAVRGKTHSDASDHLPHQSPLPANAHYTQTKQNVLPLLNLIDQDLRVPHIDAQSNNDTHPSGSWWRGKQKNLHTQLGHFHAVMGQVALTGNPTFGPLMCWTKTVRWRRKCSLGSVEMTTDAHDLINGVSSLLCLVLLSKLSSPSSVGIENVLSVWFDWNVWMDGKI